MNEYSFHKLQVNELRRLLQEVEDDPILAPQFSERLAEAEEKLKNCSPPANTPTAPLPRTAMFLRGGGVQDGGVRPTLAADVLTQYEKMFVEQALYAEREIAQDAGRARRPKGSPKPGLWFTGTPHGSFGLEFIPQTPEDPSLEEVYRNAIATVTNALVVIVSDDQTSTDKALASVASTVLKPMRLFLKSLSTHGAELRVAVQGQRSKSLTASQITKAAELLEREVDQVEIVIDGTFRGVTLQSGYFDFAADDGRSITGTVAEDVPPDFLEGVHLRTNQPARAYVVVTTIKPVTGPPRVSYLLVKAEDHPNPPKNKAPLT